MTTTLPLDFRETATAADTDRTTPATIAWTAGRLPVSVTVTDRRHITAAQSAVNSVLAEVDRACGRSRSDAELHSRSVLRGRSTTISPTLAALVDAALEMARGSGGAIDPIIGRPLVIRQHQDNAVEGQAHPSWTGDAGLSRRDAIPTAADLVQRRGNLLRIPEGMGLDVWTTAPAVTADLAGDAVRAVCGGGLVTVGGCAATRGRPPRGGWRVRLADGAPGHVTVWDDCGIASSVAGQRASRVRAAGVPRWLDPRTSPRARSGCRAASVIARRCSDAQAVGSICLTKRTDGPAWVQSLGLPARLIAADGTPETFGGWPADGH